LSVDEFEVGLEIIANDICPSGAVCKSARYTPKEPKEGLRVTKYEVRVPSVSPALQARVGAWALGFTADMFLMQDVPHFGPQQQHFHRVVAEPAAGR